MTAKKKAPQKGRFEHDNDVLVYRRVTHRYRFLLSDGRTVDVITERDDSDLRGDLIIEFGGDVSIVGSTKLEAS